MELGGVLLGAGMELSVAHGDYLYGAGRVRYLIRQVIEVRHEWNCEWVILDGMERPNATAPWRPRRLQVRVSALKRSLALVA